MDLLGSFALQETGEDALQRDPCSRDATDAVLVNMERADILIEVPLHGKTSLQLWAAGAYNRNVNPVLTQWGPALLLLLGIVLGVLYNNRSISQLDTRIADRIGHLDTRIADLMRASEIRHNDLKDLIQSEIRRLEDRIARLEGPLVRP